jgi:hypothetical protein
VKICKVHMDLNIADPLMKVLSQQKHEAHMSSMVLDIFMVDSGVSGRLL